MMRQARVTGRGGRWQVVLIGGAAVVLGATTMMLGAAEAAGDGGPVPVGGHTKVAAVVTVPEDVADRTGPTAAERATAAIRLRSTKAVTESLHVVHVVGHDDDGAAAGTRDG